MNLYRKYDVPAPRYTSYPTVPYWETPPKTKDWLRSIRESLNTTTQKNSWSMYIHIPFCETLCTYCGCNTVITKNHQREKMYLNLLHKELNYYLNEVSELKESVLYELHIGGGTPTFLSSDHLDFLLTFVLKNFTKRENWIGSVEVDPRHTQQKQLEVMRKHGFNRISLGVQDFNTEVQQLVNRIQSYEETKTLTEEARKLGYKSINFDLIYGLPQQSLKKMQNTIEKTLSLGPERIALYSLAIVPWIKPSQRIFKDEDLPGPKEKRELYEYSRDTLLAAGYIEIGMDHFSLPHDDLAIAQKNARLHRNFMGYTPLRTKLLLGIGLSAISETPDYFHQNHKEISRYEEAIHKKNRLPTLRGHCLTQEDKEQRELILQFMTHDHVNLPSTKMRLSLEKKLEEMIKDKLVVFQKNTIQITSKGKPFLRNACMALDKRLHNKYPKTQVFSKSL